MDIYDRLGVKKYINAHDTYTVYGGSRMAENTISAMREASRYFVDIQELQLKLGEDIARLTRNPAAYITNGSSAGLLLSAAVCLTEGDPFLFSRLPDTSRCGKKEIIVMRCQRNAYDAAIAASGASVVEIGDADETLETELRGVMSETTASVFYFASSRYGRAAIPLEKVIEIAHEFHVPVVVDAAAQLPPVENLWRFTSMGADLVLFSGGKTLCGPQSSGLVLGTEEMIERCRRFGAPTHGICRSGKVGREEMVGLYVALQNYLSLDHAKNRDRLESIVKEFRNVMDSTGAFRTQKLDHGPVGQTYPRALGVITADFSAEELAAGMRNGDPGIYIGVDHSFGNAVYLSPLNLKDDEVTAVASALRKNVMALLNR